MFKQQWRWWWLLPIIVCVILYAPSLSFPYSWDDLYILRFTDTLSVVDILTKVGFFRLRAFDRLVFRSSFDLWGPTGAVLAHWVSFALGALNLALITRVARALTNRHQGQWVGVAGLALLVFPLSYRDLGSATSNAHLGVATFTLAAVVCAESFRRTGRWWALAGSLGWVGIAPWGAESGVMAGLIVAAYLVIREWPAFTRRGLILSGLALGLSVALTVWVALITRGEAASPTPAQLLDKTIFFAQAFAYPAMPLAHWLLAQTHLPQNILIWCIGFGVLAVLSASLLPTALRRLYLFGLAYFGFASVISWYALTFEYLIQAPHIYYYGAVGSALVWAALVIRGLTARAPVARYLAAGLSLGIMLVNFWHVQHYFQLYVVGTAPLRGLAQAATAVAQTGGHKILAINLPSWLSYPTPAFVAQNEGAILLSEDSTAQMFLDYNSWHPLQVQAVEVADLRQATPYYLAPHGQPLPITDLPPVLRTVSGVYLANYQAQAASLQRLGMVTQESAPGQVIARFENGLRLGQVQSQVTAQTAHISLVWHLTAAPTDFNFFVHLFDCGGEVLALMDGPAIGRLYPLHAWQMGETVYDERYAPLAKPPANECYVLEIGLFDPLTGDRVPVYDSTGQPYPNAAVTLDFP